MQWFSVDLLHAVEAEVGMDMDASVASCLLGLSSPHEASALGAVRLACIRGYVHVLDVLLRHGVSALEVDSRGRSAVFYTSPGTPFFVPTMDRLIAAGASLFDTTAVKKHSLLHSYVRLSFSAPVKDDISILQAGTDYLLSKGFCIDAANADGHTALTVCRTVKQMKFLVSRGASLEIAFRPLTALFHLFRCRDASVVAFVCGKRSPLRGMEWRGYGLVYWMNNANATEFAELAAAACPDFFGPKLKVTVPLKSLLPL